MKHNRKSRFRLKEASEALDPQKNISFYFKTVILHFNPAILMFGPYMASQPLNLLKSNMAEIKFTDWYHISTKQSFYSRHPCKMPILHSHHHNIDYVLGMQAQYFRFK